MWGFNDRWTARRAAEAASVFGFFQVMAFMFTLYAEKNFAQKNSFSAKKDNLMPIDENTFLFSFF